MSSPSDPQPSAAQPPEGEPSEGQLPEGQLSEGQLSEGRAPADRPSQTSTQEIPVVAPAAVTTFQLPPHPGAVPPAPVQPVPEPLGAPQPTGPVAFVPGLPGAGTPPPPPRPPVSTAAEPTSPPPPPPAAPGDGSTGGSSATSVWPHTLEEPAVATPATHRRAPRDRAGLISAGLVVLSLVLLQLGLALRFDDETFWSELPLWSAFATVCTVLGLAGTAMVPGISRLGAGAGWRIAAGGLVGLAVFWVLVVLPVVAGDRGFLLTAALGCLGAALWTGPARRS